MLEGEKRYLDTVLVCEIEVLEVKEDKTAPRALSNAWRRLEVLEH